MSRPRGGYIGFNRVPAANAASGVWTLREAEAARRAGTWPPAADPFFSSVALLLHMDGTNGSKTFTDSSGTPKTVTAVQNAAISTTQSKFGGGSLGLTATPSYLTVGRTNSIDISLSTSWCVEAWLYMTGYAAGQNPQFNSLVYSTRGTSALAGLIITVGGIANAKKLNLYYASGTTTWDKLINAAFSTSDIPLNTWTHVAVTRNSGTMYGFVNGTLEVTQSIAGTGSQGAGGIYIGGDTGGEQFNGYIDDLRVTSGNARYTSSFTPPITPFPDR